MKNLFSTFILIFFCYCFNTKAQNSNLNPAKNNYYNGLVKMRENNLDSEPKIRESYFKSKKSKNKDSIIFYYKNALKLIETSRDDYFLPQINYSLSVFYLKQQNFKQALYYGEKCLEFSKKNNLQRLLFKSNQNFGRIYLYQGNFNNAIKYYNEALKYTTNILEELNIKCGLIAVFINDDYDSLNQEKRYKIAKSILKEVLHLTKVDLTSLSLEERYTYKAYLVYVYTYASTIEREFNKKILFAKKAILLGKEIQTNNNVDTFLLLALNNFKRINFENKKFNLAINQSKEIITLAKKNNSTLNICNGYLTIIKSLEKLKKHNELLKYVDSLSSYRITREQSYDIKSILFKVHYQNEKFKEAANYANELFKVRDTIYELEKEKAYIEYGKKYQTEKKIQENELLKKDNRIKDLEVKKQTTNRNYLIGLSIMGLIALGAVYYRYRSKKKTAVILAEQNTLINNQKIELEKSNANKQRLFGIIAHDLINPFNAILGYTQLLEEDYESFNDKERKDFIATINKYANTNYSLTRTLLDWAKIQQDRLVVNKTILNCKEIVQAALQPYQVLADKKEITVKTNILDTITIEADKNMMQTVIGNLFVNAVKFTPQKGEINLSLLKNKDGTINIEIADNGIGMTQEQLNNIFDITKVNSRQGTAKEKGNGLGLILSKELMELQKGTLQLFSQKNIGSRAVLSI